MYTHHTIWGGGGSSTSGGTSSQHFDNNPGVPHCNI